MFLSPSRLPYGVTLSRDAAHEGTSNPLRDPPPLGRNLALLGVLLDELAEPPLRPPTGHLPGHRQAIGRNHLRDVELVLADEREHLAVWRPLVRQGQALRRGLLLRRIGLLLFLLRALIRRSGRRRRGDRRS